MPLCYPSPLWPRSRTGDQEDGGFRTGSGLSDLAQVTKSHRAQCPEGTCLTPALRLYCIIFLRNKQQRKHYECCISLAENG